MNSSITRFLPLWLGIFLLGLPILLVLTFFDVTITRSSIYAGLSFLVLCLVPIYFKKLAKYRRDFGIVSGLYILLHAFYGFRDYLNFSFSALWGEGGITGLIALAVVVALLITSNYIVQRKAVPQWRLVHAFIWFALPVALVHSVLMVTGFFGEVPIGAVITLGGLSVFGIAKMFFSRSPSNDKIRDTALVIAGFVVGALIYFFW